MNRNNELYFAYATLLRDEHQQLRGCFDLVEARWQCRHLAGGLNRRRRNDLIVALTRLRAELARHWSEDKAGACVEEAAIHAPRLSQDAEKLEHEDSQLLAQLDNVIDRLRAAPKSVSKIEQDYRSLVTQICDHAARENQILEDSFGSEDLD